MFTHIFDYSNIKNFMFKQNNKIKISFKIVFTNVINPCCLWVGCKFVTVRDFYLNFSNNNVTDTTFNHVEIMQNKYDLGSEQTIE